jgi:hypothetical protein
MPGFAVVKNMTRRKQLPGSRGVRRSRGPTRFAGGKPRQNGIPAWAGLVDADLIPHGTMGRTQRLILAAVRIWELKRGFRD